jgi:hypothetical protein
MATIIAKDGTHIEYFRARIFCGNRASPPEAAAPGLCKEEDV